MTLPEADKLINDMIKEDSNYTIKDYRELRAEIAGITQSNDKPIIRRRNTRKRADILNNIEVVLARYYTDVKAVIVE